MGLMGQLTGGMIGFAFGGPIGAILGAIVGSQFGNTPAMNTHQQSQTAYFVTTFSMLGKMAQADGRIDQREIQMVKTLLRQKLRMDMQAQDFAMQIFYESTRSPYGFEDLARQFYTLFQSRPEMLHSMLDLLVGLSRADGNVSPEEDRLLSSAADIFGINRAEYQHVKEQYTPTADKYYAVLNCDPNVSNDEVKKKYRQLVRDFHPDTIVSKGLPEEFTKFAEEKFCEIQEAYEHIKKERGL